MSKIPRRYLLASAASTVLSARPIKPSVNARSAGKLTVNVLGDRLLTTQTVDVKEGMQQVRLPVGKDWGTGAYVLATLRRPLDAAAQRMPGRAIGLKWFGIDKKARTLEVNLAPPPLVRPGSAVRRAPVRSMAMIVQAFTGAQHRAGGTAAAASFVPPLFEANATY